MSDNTLDEFPELEAGVDEAMAEVFGEAVRLPSARGRFSKGNTAAMGRRQPAPVTSATFASAVPAKTVRRILRRLVKIALDSQDERAAVEAAGLLLRHTIYPQPN